MVLTKINMDSIRTDSLHIVAVIQARMTSSRLPGKVLADIAGKPALLRMLERVKESKLIDQIIVATTVNKTDDPVVDLCRSIDVQTFRGDEDDVLSRFLYAAEYENADVIVRLTADCPMIDPHIIDDVIKVYISGEFDYVSNCNERTYPDGLDVEVFSIAALREASKYATSSFCREHVTPYIRGIHTDYETGDFSIEQVKFSVDLSHIRWTVDTFQDLERVRKLISKLPENYSWFDALSLATKEPHLLGVPIKSTN